MIDLAEISQISNILEPSCGEGVFIKLLQNRGFKHITACEIDPNLAKDFNYVRYESFVSAEFDKKFDLIIGNPPYIRWKNLETDLKQELSSSELWNVHCNSLCDYLYIFILKSVELLNENGQLIFICPEYWMNTTNSISLRNYMISNGYFEKIYHFSETPIFDGVTVSIVIFKYIKSKRIKNNIEVTKFRANQKLSADLLCNLKNQNNLNDIEYLEIPQFKVNERWILATHEAQHQLKCLEKCCQKQSQDGILPYFDEGQTEYYTIGEFCDIGNGLVSGLDKAFQIEGSSLTELEKHATLNVVKAKDLKPFSAEKITKYIFLENVVDESVLAEDYPNFFRHLHSYKDDLSKRYQYNKEFNYWDWVFLRNFKLFNKQEKRIFVPCKERISNKDYFRFAIVDKGVYPTQDVTAIFKKPKVKESIEYILAYLNDHRIFYWLKHNGIVKGNIVEFSEKPIASIPFRAINWNDAKEETIHNCITSHVQKYLKTRKETHLEEINQLFNNLLGEY